MSDPRLPDRVAGNLALDLANTIGWRDTPRVIDYLPDAAAILRWAVAAGVLEDERDVDAADHPALLADVHRLRDAIQSIGSAIADDMAPPAAGLATVRRFAARSLDGATLEARPLGFAFAGVDRVIGPIAWAFLDLLRGPDADRVKQCPPSHCQWLFVDRTKNRSRRWCDMGSCGNHAKKSRSRKRREAGPPAAPR